jgi:L-alanine-DL-glutamate epimerase-like enolase superfamily enzyme
MVITPDRVTLDVPAVTGVDAAVFTVPTDAPEADGTLAWDATTMVLVTAHAGNEHGIGWTYGAAAARWVVSDQLAPVVVGRSALDVPGAAEAMARAVRNIGRAGVAATAISAVDTALWDLKARLLGCPLAGLLGRWREAVPVYGSGGFTSYSERQLGEQLAGWVERDRIPRVKIKIGEDWGGSERRDLDRVALARRVVGPDTELYAPPGPGPPRARDGTAHGRRRALPPRLRARVLPAGDATGSYGKETAPLCTVAARPLTRGFAAAPAA